MEIAIKKDVMILNEYENQKKNGFKLIVVWPNEINGLSQYVWLCNICNDDSEWPKMFIENKEDIFNKKMYIEKIEINSDYKFDWKQNMDKVSSDVIVLHLRDRKIGIAIVNLRENSCKFKIKGTYEENNEAQFTRRRCI